MRENRTSGSMRRGERRVMGHSANGHRTRKGGNGGAPPDRATTRLAFSSAPASPAPQHAVPKNRPVSRALPVGATTAVVMRTARIVTVHTLRHVDELVRCLAVSFVKSHLPVLLHAWVVLCGS